MTLSTKEWYKVPVGDRKKYKVGGSAKLDTTLSESASAMSCKGKPESDIPWGSEFDLPCQNRNLTYLFSEYRNLNYPLLSWGRNPTYPPGLGLESDKGARGLVVGSILFDLPGFGYWRWRSLQFYYNNQILKEEKVMNMANGV